MADDKGKTPVKEDALEKEYHKIGIAAVIAACSVKRHQEAPHTDYDPQDTE